MNWKEFVLLIGFIFIGGGIIAVWDFIVLILETLWLILYNINNITTLINGDSVLTIILKSSITFSLVGVLLEYLNIRRGKFGYFFGKISNWLIGFPVAIVLNIVARFFY